VLAAGPLALAGCYDMHGLGPGADAGVDVPRPPVEDGGGIVLRDVMAIGDAPALTCPIARADASCLESFAIPAGLPVELPFQFDGCGCCIETQCAVSVDAAARVLSLETHLCPDPCDCDTCITPTGTCSVPPLPLDALGEWTVRVNGTSAFRIGVIDPFDPVAPPPPGCATYAEIDDCGGAQPDFTMGPVRGCVEHHRPSDRDTLVLYEACGTCGEIPSACDASLLPRFTADLPPGADIQLHARRYFTGCDVDCPDVCIEQRFECALPPLAPGEYYRVFVDGELAHSFTAGAPDPATCLHP
jgi:hypothetical protein